MNGFMKKRGFAPLILSSHPWTLGLLLGVSCYSPVVRAQQPPTPSHATPVASEVPSGIPSKAIPHDILSDDPRLDVKVTLTRRDVTVEEALRELTKQTKVGLAAFGNEAPSWQMAFAVRDEPLRDVLRAMAAALNDCRWKRVKATDRRDVLTLMDISGDPRYYDFLRPKTQEEADMHRGVEDFVGQFSQLPPDAQKAFAPGGPGVGYGSLSPAMQQGVRQAFAAYLQGMIARGGKPWMTEDDVQNMKVTLQSRHPDASTLYTVQLAGPLIPLGVGGGIISGATLDARVPDDPSALDETVQPPDFTPWQRRLPQIMAARFDASRAQAIQNDPRLSRIVSVKSEDTSLGFALAALAEAAHVNIVAETRSTTHTVSLGPLPLKDALDQITAKYQAAWAEAEDGTILVGFHRSDSGDGQKTATK